MNMEDNREQLDRAVSTRLARLADRPVDTGQIEKQLNALLVHREPSRSTDSRLRWSGSWRTIASAAAVILVMFTIGLLVLNGGSNPAVAAPTALAQIHFDVARGLTPHLTVSSVEEANQRLAEQAEGARPLPMELPGEIMSCCLHEYAGTTLSCVLIKQDDTLITIALADGAKMHSPEGEIITYRGREFMAHEANGVNMVMAHKSDRWLCVMGEVSIDQLVEVAAGVEM